jgi:peptidoglycan hydrolase-like protein with peptidoglycan-binding domain
VSRDSIRRHRLEPLAWLASICIAAAIGGWAVRATITVPDQPASRAAPVLYTVSVGTVERVQSFTAQASWSGQSLGRNSASGTVTTVDVIPGREVAVGDRLYSVDLRPVIAAAGAVPSFRDLSSGAKGRDVRQLQQFLRQEGFYAGPLSGSFSRATNHGVRRWQKALGEPADGTVRSGDLLFLPTLPIRVAPGEALRVGAVLGGGETVLEVLPAGPVFTVTLGADQAKLVPLSGKVKVHHDDGTWTGSIAASTTTASGELVLTLEGSGGSPICDDQCELVPLGDPTLYRVDLVSVPETSGPLVPSAALATGPDGTAYVIDRNGMPIGVTVVAAVDGRAVVSGIEPGQVVRLFGTGRGSESVGSPPPSPR